MTARLTVSALEGALRDALAPGMTLALGDGVGTLGRLDDESSVGASLSAVARDVGGIRLILGWLPTPIDGLAVDAFANVVALMPGWGVRDVLASPTAHFLPTRLSAIPALLSDVFRPDVLLTRLVRRNGRLQFGSEVSWQRAVFDNGARTLGVVDARAPAAAAGPALDDSEVEVLGTVRLGLTKVPQRDPEPLHDALADEVLRLIPAGARVQYGPGQLATALLRRTQVPLRIDTGMLTDAVVDLDKNGLLDGMPSATYLFGTDVLYDWADERPILHGIEHTHDLTRLSRGVPLVAVNTAIEIDSHGQINVEGVGEKVFGGIGGHPDYCTAARLSTGGLSIIAIPSRFNGTSPLVERLSRPASTLAHDVDVIVTEHGHADLRAASWSQRQHLIAELFAR